MYENIIAPETPTRCRDAKKMKNNLKIVDIKRNKVETISV
jgi:hypothetical protein